MNYDSQDTSSTLPARRRRLVALIAAALALILWGPRTANMVEKGWSSSVQALEHQRQIDLAQQRIDALQREVAYARTSEGKDVEAKRRFGVGPRDEIWITVEAEKAPDERPRPRSIADRVDWWLANAGSRFVDRIREVVTIVSYSFGLSEVDAHVAVPVVEQIEAADTEEAEETAAESPAEDAGGDGEAAGDGARQQ
jgi:hypothetical protein